MVTDSASEEVERRDVGAVAAAKPGRGWFIGGVLTLAAGIALALVVVRVGVRQTVGSRAFVDQPEYAVWGGLVFLLVTAGAVLGVVSMWWAAEIRSLPPNDTLPLWRIVLAWLGAAVAVAALLQAQGAAMPLDYQRGYPDAMALRIMLTGALGSLVIAVPITALLGLSRAVAAIDPTAADAAGRFSSLWSRQRELLGAVSAVLVLNVLTTAAKLELNNNFTPPDGPPLPEVPVTYVLVAGTIYASILLVVYLPNYFTARRAGEALAQVFSAISSDENEASGRQASGPEAWLAMDERRQRYRSALGLAEGTRQHLERNVVLLAPLLTALLTTLLPDVSP